VFLLRLGRCHRGGFSSFSTVVEKMTNKESADAAGVTEKTVRNYRQRRERIGISDSEPKIRVNKQGKRRPTKYKKRKPKSQAKRRQSSKPISRCAVGCRPTARSAAV
jgi:hypothetical protein